MALPPARVEREIGGAFEKGPWSVTPTEVGKASRKRAGEVNGQRGGVGERRLRWHCQGRAGWLTPQPLRAGPQAYPPRGALLPSRPWRARCSAPRSQGRGSPRAHALLGLPPCSSASASCTPPTLRRLRALLRTPQNIILRKKKGMTIGERLCFQGQRVKDLRGQGMEGVLQLGGLRGP